MWRHNETQECQLVHLVNHKLVGAARAYAGLSSGSLTLSGALQRARCLIYAVKVKVKVMTCVSITWADCRQAQRHLDVRRHRRICGLTGVLSKFVYGDARIECVTCSGATV